jgi:hypothetical protein
LTVDDWNVIAQYVELLKPCKTATMKLQGNVSTAAKHGTVKGAIWQVLPVFEEMLSAFEEARDRHRPAESQQGHQQASPTSKPPSTPSPDHRSTTQSPQPTHKATTSTPTDRSASDARVSAATEPETQDRGVDDSPLESQYHFSTNINAGWQKLEAYYMKTDNTPVYRAAVVLHPRMKWRWFHSHWKDHPNCKLWIEQAHKAVEDLWSQYKADTSNVAVSPGPTDESDSDDDSVGTYDQLEQYVHEPRLRSSTMSIGDSPIPYWISKLPVWPQLAQMSLDIYSTPACSDEPERVFSMAGNVLNPRRRCLTGDTVQELLCLRSWERSGIIKLQATDYEEAVASADGASIDLDLYEDELI